MKRFLKISLSAAFATLATLSVTSCETDKCKAIVCANGSVCEEDGSCTCPVGYEGERCETESRARYRGTWTVDEDGTVSNVNRYPVSIENREGVIDQVQIRNFNNQLNAVVYATVVKDSIFIAPQSYMVGAVEKTVMGYGVADPTKFYGNHGSITMYYRVTTSEGVTDDFGYRGSGQPSIWVK